MNKMVMRYLMYNKIDDPSSMNICTFKKMPQLLQKIYKCTKKQNSNMKLSHTYASYIDTTLCKAMSFSIIISIVT